MSAAPHQGTSALWRTKIDIPLPFEGGIQLPTPMTSDEWQLLVSILGAYERSFVRDESAPVVSGSSAELEGFPEGNDGDAGAVMTAEAKPSTTAGAQDVRRAR